MRNTFLLIIFLIALLPTVGNSQQPGWQWLNPKPEGNGVTSIYFTSDMTGYAATRSNAIMKTTDGGISWGLKYIPAEIILKDVQFVNSLTGYISTTTNKLCKTTNAGMNWVVIDALRPDLKFRNFTFKDVNSGYAAYDSLFGGNAFVGKTTDGGFTWIEIRSDTISLQSRILSNNNELFLAWKADLQFDTAYISKSTNDGVSWFHISQFPFHSVQDFRFTSSTTGYLQLSIGNSPRLYRSTTAGSNWFLINDSLDNFQALDDNNLVSLKYSKLYRSSNGGINWQTIQISPSYYSGKYFFINSNTGIIAGADYSRTTNGGANWTITYDNMTTDFYGMDFTDENTGFVSGYRNVYKTTNGGESWDTNFVDPDEEVDDIQFLDSQTGYMGCFYSGRIAKTTNCGGSWEMLPTSIVYGLSAIDFININTGYATAKYGPVAKTTNGGLNWENVATIQGQSWDIDFIDANTGIVANGYRIKRTSDGGTTWTDITLPQNRYTYQVKFIDDSTVFAGGNDICKSTDAGITWFVSYDISNNTSNLVGEFEFINNIIYATENYGGKIHKSTDRGNTWRTYKTISNTTAWRVKFANENTGYICGNNGMLIKTTNGGFDPIGIEPISTEIPSGFSLHQNYPNPFNPSTKIKFAIPKALLVRLTVYDILGRQVAELVNQNLNAGTFEYEWSGAQLSSGIYFYKLHAGDFVETRRMVLVK